MSSHFCSIVPPYLLRGIVESQHEAVAEEERECARNSLSHREHFVAKRCDRFDALSQPHAARAAAHQAPTQQSIVPEVLLQHIAECEDVDEETRDRARADIEHTRRVISQYQAAIAPEEETGEGAPSAAAAKPKPKPKPSTGFYRAVYDAKNDPDEEDLPGTVVRVEGQKAIKDQTANDAYDNVGRVLDFYLKQFNWKSIDNKNMHVISTVHFAKKYENAFWDPTRMQMVFGDGDKFLYRFASCLDVIGHELTVSPVPPRKPVKAQDKTNRTSTPSRSTPAPWCIRASRGPSTSTSQTCSASWSSRCSRTRRPKTQTG
jgi:hypothetical protein